MTTTTDRPDPLRLDFHLLDRQIIDTDGEPVGKVDDVELTVNPGTGQLQVTALLSGQQVLGERIRGRVGGALAGVARRLRTAEQPPPLRIGMHLVAGIGSAVTLTIPRHALPTAPLEEWLTDHVINEIPGAGHAGQ
jgi:sporulation protein YlmC with PRC-barrel domain